MEYFEEVKNNPTYSIGILGHTFLSIFLHFSRVNFIIILSISLKFPVGQSRNFDRPVDLLF